MLHALPSPTSQLPRASVASNVLGLLDDARRLLTDDATSAVASAEEAVRAAHAARDHRLTGEAGCLLGQALFSLSRHADAIDAFRRARREFARSSAPDRIADTHRHEMAVHAMCNDRARALAAARAARKSYRQLGDEVALAKLAANTATMMHRFGGYAAAVRRYREALDFFRPRGMKLETASVALNLANVLSLMEREGEAESLYRLSIDSFEELGRTRETAQTRYNLAYLQFLQGRCREALDGLDQAEAFFSSIKDPLHVALCHLDRAELHLELGLMPEAASQASVAIDLFDRLQLDNEGTRARLFFALARRQLGYKADADELLRVAADAFERLQNPVWAATLHHHRASCALERSDLDLAETLAHKALKIFERAPVPSSAARTHLLLSSIARRRNETERSRDHLQRAIALSSRDRSPWVEIRARLALAQLESSPTVALRSIDRALLDLDRLHVAAPTSNWEETLAGDREQIYAEAVRLSLNLAADAQPETIGRAFLYAERARNRSALERLMRPVLRQHTGDRVGDDHALRLLVSTLSRVRHQRWYVEKSIRRLERDQKDPKRARRLHRVAKRLGRRDADCSARLAGANWRVAALYDLVTPSPDQLIEHLPKDAALIEFAVTGDEIAAFRLDRNGLKLHRLKTGLADVLHHLQALQFQVNKLQLGEEYAQRHAAALLVSTNEHLSQLGQALLEDVVADCPESRRLVFAPHGFLHYVPFHALRVAGRTLLDEFEVTTIPSASLLPLCGNRSGDPRGTGALIVGLSHPTMPHVDQEIARVAELLPDATVIRDEEATWDRVRTLAEGRRYLHVSTHGRVRADNPMASSLLLADRWVTYVDASELKLSADLVVLAACHAGVDRLISGDEQLGLGRILLEAGARALITTLWAVQDESIAAWMGDFYEHRLTGSSISGAFRHACLAARERNPHPAHWAPCQLIGALGDDGRLQDAPDQVRQGEATHHEHRRGDSGVEVNSPYKHVASDLTGDDIVSRGRFHQ